MIVAYDCSCEWISDEERDCSFGIWTIDCIFPSGSGIFTGCLTASMHSKNIGSLTANECQMSCANHKECQKVTFFNIELGTLLQ